MDNLQTMAHGNSMPRLGDIPSHTLGQLGEQEAAGLDLNRLLVRQASSTYLFQVSGHHWADQGMYDGDVAIIDCAAQAHANDLIIAWYAGSSVLCKQHQLTDEHAPWGVVTAVIHQYRLAAPANLD